MGGKVFRFTLAVFLSLLFGVPTGIGGALAETIVVQQTNGITEKSITNSTGTGEITPGSNVNSNPLLAVQDGVEGILDSEQFDSDKASAQNLNLQVVGSPEEALFLVAPKEVHTYSMPPSEVWVSVLFVATDESVRLISLSTELKGTVVCANSLDIASNQSGLCGESLRQILSSDSGVEMGEIGFLYIIKIPLHNVQIAEGEKVPIKVSVNCVGVNSIELVVRYTPLTFPQSSEWYVGDTHVHSLFSDGIYTIAELADYAKSNGFKFVVMTDHVETMLGTVIRTLYPPSWSIYISHCTAYSNQQCRILPGVEYAVSPNGPSGHCLAYNLSTSAGSIPPDNTYTPQALVYSIRNHNPPDSFSVAAHPNNFEYPWQDVDVKDIEGWQLMNDGENLPPYETISSWFSLLRSGFNITLSSGNLNKFVVGIGGSDFHGWPWQSLGEACTYIYSPSGLPDNNMVWNQIRKGCVSASAKGDLGFFTIDEQPQGSVIEKNAGDKLTFAITQMPLDSTCSCIYIVDKDYDPISNNHYEYTIPSPSSTINYWETLTPISSTFYDVFFEFTDTSGTKRQVWSNPIFIKVKPSIHVQTPNGDEIWPIGSAQSIVWKEGATASPNEVRLFVSRSPNQWEQITTLSPAPNPNNSYLWTVTGPASNTCRIRIVYCNSAANYLAADESDGYFTIGTSGNSPPSVPSNPTPSSSSMNRPVSQVLQWNPCSDPAGDPITYDVYFGTSSSPSAVSQGQASTSYDPPGNLGYSTTYYWKVVAKDSHGAATNGPLWSFTTATQTSDPFPIVEALIPTSGTVNQPVTLSFALSNVGGAAEHGGISISFPELNVVSVGSMPPYSSAKGDVAASSPDGLSLGFYDVGDQIARYPPSSGNVAAQHLLVEGIYGSWGANVSKSLNLLFTPKTTGTFRIRFRGWLTKNGFQTYFGHPSSGSTDQQGFYTFEQTIQVSNQPPQTGTINVQSSPSGALFSIAGPGYSNNGSTPWTQTGLTPGDYTVNWGDLSNYTKPNPNTQTLPAGGSSTFNGNYTPADPGYGQLLGHVRDPQGNPIEGARVTLSNNQYADTDGSGYYLIWYVPPGSYGAQAKKSAYADSPPAGVIVQPYNATVHDFTLTKLEQFSLNLDVNPAGSGYISAEPIPDPATGKYAIGTLVTLTPHPAPGYIFSTWSGDAFGSSYPIQVNMTGAKSVAAVFNPPGEAWKETSNGLYGACVNSIAIDPQNSSIIYAGTSYGVYKTTDGGASWTRTSTGLTSLSINVLTVSQSSPSTIYAGTLGSGIFKSMDSGVNWSPINSGLSNLRVQTIAVDPQNASTVYVGTQNGGGAFKTTNGSSWSPINNGLGNTTVNCLLLNPQNANIVFAATGGGCYKSTNGGLNWSWLSDDLGGLIHTLAIDPTNNNLMFAVTSLSGLYKSTNGGVNWSPANTGLPASGIEVVCMHPSDSNTAYAATQVGVFKTVNGATSWTSVSVGLTNLYVRALALNHQNPSNLYAGTVYSGVFKSTDAASSWQSANIGLNNAAVQVIVADPGRGGTIYAGLVGNGIFKTTNGATTWLQINNGLGGLMTEPCLIMHPSVPGLLYAGMGDGLYRTTDGGATWTRTSTLSATCMILDPANPAIIYAGGNGVFTSLDGGSTWTKTSTGLANRTIKVMVINPLTPSTLYVGTDSGVYKTTDGALNWTKTSTGITLVGGGIPSISCMAINPQNPEIIYSGIWIGSDGGIYKTSNGGASWSLVNNGLTNLSVASLVVDPLAPDMVYAGLSAAGVCKTTNGGGNWVPMNSGLTENSIMDLAIDPLTASIYVGTAGAGIFKYPYAGQLPKVLLTRYSEPFGSGTVIANPLPGADGTYTSGTRVTLTASANAGYRFDHWSGTALGTENPTQICVSASSEVIAHFSPLPAPVIFGRVVSAVDGQSVAGITLSFSNGCGSTVTATDGYYLKQVIYGWSGTVTPSSPKGGLFSPATQTYPALTEGLINQDYVWTPPSFTLNVQLDSGGGGIVISNPAQPTGGYLAGTEIRLTAYPSSGYAFSGWSGDASGTNNPIQTVVDRNKSVMASFVQSQSQSNLPLLTGWNLISLPLQPESPNPASVFSGLPSGWVLFAWDGVNNRYLGGGQISLITGIGYWLKLPGSGPLSYSISGQLVTSDPFLVPLSEGWNIIGTPYLNNVSWGNARLRYLGNDYTLANAVTQNYIAGAVYFWTGTGYGNAAGGNFEPGKGYWLRAKVSGCSLVFPKP